jgi:DNA-directed RNA polymerase II subunit RPB7
MREYLKRRLHEDVEGTCSGRFGYIIAVASIEDIGKGKIREGLGVAEFSIKYKAVVFKPFKGEVLEAVVTLVNKVEGTCLCFSLVAAKADGVCEKDGIFC